MKTLSHPALKQGDVLDGKYVLRHCIGHGGMGSVFLAEQAALGRKVAIKVLHPEFARCPAHAARIRDEAIAASHVRSSHCLNVIDCSALPDGGSYLVMEYVPGRSLARIIAEESVPLSRVIDLFEQVLAALSSIHDAGIVHADVKSDNFLVESLDGRDHVTMIDFGLARFTGSSPGVELEDGEAIVSGTPEYMAPEVVCGGPPIAESDLYGAGVILYELLTGTTPFGGGYGRSDHGSARARSRPPAVAAATGSQYPGSARPRGDASARETARGAVPRRCSLCAGAADRLRHGAAATGHQAGPRPSACRIASAQPRRAARQAAHCAQNPIVVQSPRDSRAKESGRHSSVGAAGAELARRLLQSRVKTPSRRIQCGPINS